MNKTLSIESALAPLVLAIMVLGCSSLRENGSNQALNVNEEKPKTTVAIEKPNDDGTIPSGTGVEREKPADGKGNVQGAVFFNEKPAAGVEVKLCEKFSRFGRGCSGETLTTKTDEQGEYLIKDATPRIYEGLVVKVFESDFYVFATSGYVQSAKYNIEAGKTYFAPNTNLFKQDLKVTKPKAGSKIGSDDIEVIWEAYPETEYYKLSIHADTSSGAETVLDFVNKRIDGTSYLLDKPLTPGAYTVRLDAYNANDIKLAQSASNIKFTVTGGSAK